ncbi:superoxide dismutase [Bradyrhizobium lablabi]|uniref:superoxide dismutase n=1 Tax=Bradyrhizobium lablabi TaxID=722472 RepID=UPI001BAA03F8|nr:superoxide dismutase [Bradyrhizobium lablabi]MBR1126305.1 superoxide dismutase [Bradyrhizobium lablabi]
MPSLSRRHLFSAAAGAAAFAAVPRIAFAQAAAPAAAPAATGPFTLPPLSYPFNALEPHIDARTMEIHHDRHHAAYVANMNNVAKSNPQLGTAQITDVLGNLNALNDDIKFTVRNNLGGHANHTMFWEIMGPGGGGKPEGDLLAAIDKDLGGMEKFQNDFNAAGGRQFGSGWVFVTVAKDGKLAIETRPNQDSPIMDGKRALMGNDVWEHAYYLHYQNRRPDYLKAWWNTVNWKKVADRYAAARTGTLGV